MANDPKAVAIAYIEGCAAKRWEAVEPLLAPGMQFIGPNGAIEGVDKYMPVLRRLGPIWARSDIKKVFTDGGDVCVLYDFVTDTPAGAVPAVEWLRVEGGRIARIQLVFDRVAFKPVADELARRAQK